MRNLVTWKNPFRELEDILDRYSNVTHNNIRHGGAESNELTIADWAPSVDISEKKDAYNIKVELPGVAKDDVNVTLEQGVLSIRGEKLFEQEKDDGKTHRVECSYGQFARSFSLPESVQEDKVEASCKNGVLNLQIPKAPACHPKAIEIKVQ